MVNLRIGSIACHLFYPLGFACSYAQQVGKGHRNRRLSACISVLLFFGCFLFLSCHQGNGAISNGLTVITYNMGTITGRLPEINHVIKLLSDQHTADVIFLQEVPSEQIAKQIGGRLGLPFNTFSNYGSGGKHGLAILARYPLSAHNILRQDGYASLSARMKFMGERLMLCSVHLARIESLFVKNEEAVISWMEFVRILCSEVFTNNTRAREVGHLIPWMNTEDRKWTIASGDFNTFPFSMAIRKMNSVYDDCLWPSMDYLTTSYPKIAFPIKPRIDYIFHSPHLRCSSAGVIKDTAGDHYPVWAKIEMGNQD